MRSIIIFRHGKSDWGAIYDRDHDSPLCKRGVKASKKMGQYLNTIHQVPEIVVSSSAIRTKNTAKLAIEHGNWSSKFFIETKIYGGTSETLLSIIHSTEDKYGSICLGGHEPTCSSFISLCTYHSQRFTTASMANINFKTNSWGVIKFGGGILEWIKSPKEIP